jgi:hypothetical protein
MASSSKVGLSYIGSPHPEADTRSTQNRTQQAGGVPDPWRRLSIIDRPEICTPTIGFGHRSIS